MPTDRRLPRTCFFRASVWLGVFAVLVAVAILPGCSGDALHDKLRVLTEKRHMIATLRTDLLLAVNAEQNALLSPTQLEARQFLATARASMGDLEKNMDHLVTVVRGSGNAAEKAALTGLESDFGEMAALDATLRTLAGRNTNIQAAMLSRTEAALAVSRLQQALTPVIDSSFCPASQEALRIVAATLSILSLHAQHIDEKTAAGMDTLETAMNRHNARVQAAFDRLSGLLPPDAATGLPLARAAYADFWRVTGEVLGLSRQNTNIEAEALVMGRKRLLTAKTLADLAAFEALLGTDAFTATR